MKSDAKSLVEQLKEPTDRQRVSMYVSKRIYDDFQKRCKGAKVSASKIIESLMQQFLNDLRDDKSAEGSASSASIKQSKKSK